MHPVGNETAASGASSRPLVVAIIPARYQSSRFPGKPLAEIDGRPMIAHVHERVARARGIDRVIVATDDARIAGAVERFGGTVAMTGAQHRTGTDRIAEVARHLDCGIVVNVQGDLPLIAPAMIEEALAPLVSEPGVQMATLRRAITDADECLSPHVVKVVVDRNGDALYFSRLPLPYRQPGAAAAVPVFKHLGLYVYRRDFLLTFAALPQTPLELSESLEQLRALEHGYRIRTVTTAHESIEVDTPDDLERLRRHLAVAAPG